MARAATSPTGSAAAVPRAGRAAGIALSTVVVALFPVVHAEPSPGGRPRPWGVFRDHAYIGLATIVALVFLNATLIGEIMPLWTIDAPRPLLGALLALNTIMAVALQVRPPGARPA